MYPPLVQDLWFQQRQTGRLQSSGLTLNLRRRLASIPSECDTRQSSPYTFSVKPKWRTVVFWFFVARSSAEAYLRTSPPRGHSTIGAPMRCEDFVAIWLRAREDIAANRFQLLFINIDNAINGGCKLHEAHATITMSSKICLYSETWLRQPPVGQF